MFIVFLIKFNVNQKFILAWGGTLSHIFEGEKWKTSDFMGSADFRNIKFENGRRDFLKAGPLQVDPIGRAFCDVQSCQVRSEKCIQQNFSKHLNNYKKH